MTKNQLLALKPNISKVRVIDIESGYYTCEGTFIGWLGDSDHPFRHTLARVKHGSSVMVWAPHNIELVKKATDETNSTLSDYDHLMSV